jgi:hypothetical protein
MYFNEKQLNYVSYELHLLKIFYPFEFFLQCPCTTEQWLAYHWWYTYHNLRNPVLD